MSSVTGLQPFMNDEVVVLSAPTQVWSRRDGEVGGVPIHGLYHADWRYLSSLRLAVDGRPLELAGSASQAGRLQVHGLARTVDDPTPDPRVLVVRDREVRPGVVTETLRVRNGLGVVVEAPVELQATIEFTELMTVKAGRPHPVEIDVTAATGEVVATDGTRTLRISADGWPLAAAGDQVVASGLLTVPPGGEVVLSVTFAVDDPSSVVRAGSVPIDPLPSTGDAALDRWAVAAIDDCRSLVLDAGEGAFTAAGVPWFFTLFGRDSLITARFLLPLSLDLAHSTLTALAARQGRRHDPETAEQPGKILHELRSATLDMPGEGISLPPTYYGTIDATGLWIILLHDAWRAGLERARVEALLPALEAALGWLRDHASPDDSGYLKYIDTTGHGLANQGWKDSGDSIRFGDGSIAQGPIALAEVQAQACLAAENGADLLEEFGHDGSFWREWAQAMRMRFREDFWVDRDGARFPAVALDGRGVPVDSLTSNIGQLIGTTLLTPQEERQLADLLVEPRFASGFGLRTMATTEGGFWPLSYHCGSVWPHDTAIAVEGMLRAGLVSQAEELARQLVRAADAFGSRLPELFSGFSAAEVPMPVAYPASCRPQAWAAAAVVPVHAALTAREALGA